MSGAQVTLESKRKSNEKNRDDSTGISCPIVKQWVMSPPRKRSLDEIDRRKGLTEQRDIIKIQRI
jgi:hypothetical protein